jgi:YqaJ-like viral recombinase domain
MIQIHNMPQNSPEWFDVRKGIPTASKFSDLLAKGEGKTRAAYMRFLAGEIITGEPGESFQSDAMKRGHVMEPEARDLYAFTTGAELEQVGFITNGPKGGSPDSLIGADGLLEIKTCNPPVLIDIIDRDQFPPAHKAQCQGNLWVSEREWCDLVCYWPRMPCFCKRVFRDEAYIRELSAEVDRFNADLNNLVAKIRSYGART